MMSRRGRGSGSADAKGGPPGEHAPSAESVTTPATRDQPRQLVFEEVPPRADALAESLRAFGYTLPNAVSDLIDNSITAGATKVQILGWWSGSASWLRVRDDGRGMTEDRLVEAMRPGTFGPAAPRDPGDLGRFGLGLKTASFSQCRVVTVRSKAAGRPEATRCWDLDYVRETQLWRLLRQPRDDAGSQALGHFSEDQTGTVVLWQHMDRVVGSAPTTDERAHADFVRHLKELSGHLSVVFHRFLSGREMMTIEVNDQPIEPWDPFLSGEPFTQQEPVETFGSGDRSVVVRPYILPHQSKMSSMQAFEAAAGPRGWNAQQGFYIYRNRRLIVSGGWLGLYHAEEHYKLARIQVDIGNALDHEWQLDVRKARARPPDDIRAELKRIADSTRRLAREVYVHRGRPVAREGSPLEAVYVWEALQREGGTGYRINRSHPLVRSILMVPTLPKESGERALRIIEETVPIQHILSRFDLHARSQPAPFAGPSASEMADLIAESARVLAETGLRGEGLRKTLMLIEPFQHYPDVVDVVVDAMTGGGAERGA